jgi:hypothetical protein
MSKGEMLFSKCNANLSVFATPLIWGGGVCGLQFQLKMLCGWHHSLPLKNALIITAELVEDSGMLIKVQPNIKSFQMFQQHATTLTA